jgi:acylphosphatase
MSVRRKVVVKGALQGVTYLAQAQRVAHNLGVRGWVRNAPNGDVEACFEGDESAVYAMLAWCFVGSERARVEQVVIRRSKYKGRFKELSIRDERSVA